MRNITIYADGGCRNNQEKNNIGGWGSVVEVFSNGVQEVYSNLKDGTFNTTNNIMELTAAIESLKYINSEEDVELIEVFMDSAYVVNGYNDWIKGWKSKNWIKSDKKPVKNVELWKELDQISESFEVKPLFKKVKGHSDNEGNNLADQLANEAMDRATERLAVLNGEY